MKKLIITLIFGLFLFSDSSIARQTKWIVGQTYEGEIKWKGRTKIVLPPGEFTLLHRFDWTSWGIWEKGVWLVETINGNTFHQNVSIYNVGSVKYIAYLRQWYHSWLFNDPYDGCYQRNEYTLVKVKKGGFINCFWVGHEDVQKELYSPDDPQSTSVYWKYYINKYNLEYPRIILCTSHILYSPTINEHVSIMSHCINPETHGASKSKFFTEESSEYHPANIDKYPDKKKFMEEFIKQAAQRHKIFEKGMRAKEHQIMDLSEYGAGDIVEEAKITNSNAGITVEIKELYELYKEGALTKEEFEKAKKKILNR